MVLAALNFYNTHDALKFLHDQQLPALPPDLEGSEVFGLVIWLHGYGELYDVVRHVSSDTVVVIILDNQISQVF